MRVCTTKKYEQPWLLPGCRSKKMTSPHEKTCVVGGIFEELTAVVLKGSRLQIDSTYECCPDVIKPNTVIESKASCRTCFVIHENQLVNYRRLHEDHLTSVWFALWRYRKVDGLPPTDVLTEQVVAGVQDLFLVDFPVVERLADLAPTMYYIRHREGRVAYRRVDNRALSGLYADPEGFAGEGFTVTRRTVRATISIDGVKHTTPRFRVVSVLDPLPF